MAETNDDMMRLPAAEQPRWLAVAARQARQRSEGSLAVSMERIRLMHHAPRQYTAKHIASLVTHVQAFVRGGLVLLAQAPAVRPVWPVCWRICGAPRVQHPALPLLAHARCGRVQAWRRGTPALRWRSWRWWWPGCRSGCWPRWARPTPAAPLPSRSSRRDHTVCSPDGRLTAPREWHPSRPAAWPGIPCQRGPLRPGTASVRPDLQVMWTPGLRCTRAPETHQSRAVLAWLVSLLQCAWVQRNWVMPASTVPCSAPSLRLCHSCQDTHRVQVSSASQERTNMPAAVTVGCEACLALPEGWWAGPPQVKMAGVTGSCLHGCMPACAATGRPGRPEAS